MWQTAWRLADRDEDSRPPGPDISALDPDEQRSIHLALLHAVGVTCALLEGFEQDAAQRAGNLGAGYPQLAGAWRVTRQAARRRWPPQSGPSERPLRQALGALVAHISTSQVRNPRTAAHLIGPAADAATALAGTAGPDLAEAAARLLAAPVPGAQDSPTIGPLLADLGTALSAYLANGIPGALRDTSRWKRFLASDGA
ncbi:hypothetical protein ACFQ9X_31905 [Catenulispora yoronensis]